MQYNPNTVEIFLVQLFAVFTSVECTSNCKTCRGSSCSVCEQGYALNKGFGGWGNGRCVQKCPRGYKTEVNPSGGKECVKRKYKVRSCSTCLETTSAHVRLPFIILVLKDNDSMK